MISNQNIFPTHTIVTQEPITICKPIDNKIFNYPFFNDGVRDMAVSALDNKFYRLNELKELRSFAQLELKGFIFHTSHCGSTLLSRMLNTSKSIRVVSETEAINGLLLAFLFYKLPEGKVLDHLKSIIEAYRHSAGDEKYLIFKLTSWNVFFIKLFQKLYPTVRCIYIDRKTEDVVASLKKSSNGMVNWWDHPVDELRKHFVGQNFKGKTKEEYLTRIIKQHRLYANRYKNKELCFLSYPDFLDEFENKILTHFNLTYSTHEINKSKEVRNYDAKSSTQNVYFRYVKRNGIYQG